MIKKTISLLAIAVFVMTVSCKKENVLKDKGAGNAAMEFNEKIHDFGTLNAGDKVETVFTFTNTGKEDLIITEAKGSCGCTIPEYPKTPVKPGEKGTMKVSFNSSGKSGKQHKIVTIKANTATGIETLDIKASVTPKTGIAQ
jgi:hypothetical protein